MKLNKIKKIIICLFFLFLLVFAIGVYNHIDDAYAQWTAADMVIVYMKNNNEKWPKNWSDLNPYYEKCSRVPGWPYSKFQSRINIDFNANIEDLKAASIQPGKKIIDVIGANSIFSPQMGDGPNKQIIDYLVDSNKIQKANKSELRDASHP